MRANQPETAVRRLLGLLCARSFMQEQVGPLYIAQALSYPSLGKLLCTVCEYLAVQCMKYSSGAEVLWCVPQNMHSEMRKLWL